MADELSYMLVHRQLTAMPCLILKTIQLMSAIDGGFVEYSSFAVL